MNVRKKQTMPVGDSDTQVSVVMVTYKTGPVLWSAIDSVLNQGIDLELIVVNNGNEPEIETRLRELEAESTRVRLLSGHGNVGFARGCNLGAAVAQGTFLMLQNPDCVLFPDSISALMDAAADLPTESLLGANLLDADGEPQANARREFATPWRMVVELLKLHKIAPRHPYFRSLHHTADVSSKAATSVPVVSGALMFMKSALYRDLGGMDERFFLHVEDLEFCLRHHLSGGETFFVPRVRAYHYQSSSKVKWINIEWHKAQSFCLYFDSHFTDYYPRPFLVFVKCAVYVGFSLRALKRLITYPVRSWRFVETDFPQGN